MRRIFFPRRGKIRRRVATISLVIGGAILVAGLVSTALSRIDRPVRIIDAGTLTIGGTPVRLFGIEAPPRTQTCRDADGTSYGCGERAVNFAKRMIRGKAITCTAHPSGGAVCYADGDDIGWALVRAGWALHGPGTSIYLANEREARTDGRGMWSGSFERPSQWRRRNEAAPSGPDS